MVVLEAFESRRLLSVAGVRAMEWESRSIDVFAGRWIVQLDSVTGSRDQQTADAESRASVQKLIRVQQQLVSDGLFLVNTPTSWSASRAMREFRKLPGFRSAEPDRVMVSEAVPNDPSYSQMWGLDQPNNFDVNAPLAWDITTGSSSVVVGVIDSGVDWRHPDLLDNVYTNPSETPGNGIDDDANGFVDDVHGWDFLANDNDPTDVFGHGTHVAGTIGARGNNALGVTGVNWNVSIMPFRCGGVDPSDRTLSGAALLASMNYVTLMRQRGVNIRATNNSWGGGGASPQFQAAVQAHNNLGVLFVAAAGNDGRNTDAAPNFPSGYDIPNVIAVANITSTGSLATSSNYGVNSVDVGAPGSAILSTYLGNGYASLTGTSMASPHVAGAVALAFAAVPTATVANVKQAILESATPTASLAGKVVSGGRLNVAAMLQVLASYPATPSSPDLVSASDSGQTSFDNITNDSTPTFAGTALPGEAIFIRRNGTIDQTLQADTNGSWTYTPGSALPDGAHRFTAQARNANGTSAESDPAVITIDTVSPTTFGNTFSFAALPHRVIFSFSENVADSFTASDVVLQNLTTGQTLAASDLKIAYTASTNSTAVSILSGGGILTSGNYRLSLPATSINDAAGNNLAAASNFDFYFLNGDLSPNRKVDFNDLLILTQNFSKTGQTYTQGNLDYDPQGNVDFSDLLIMVQNYKLSLSLAPLVSVATPRTFSEELLA